ncbi:MAG: serine/threonine protein phosphatase, partial [Thiomonas sp. 20-64-5]
MDPTDHYPPSRLPPLPKPVQHQAGTRWRLNAASGLHKGDRPYQQDHLCVIAHLRLPGCLLAVIAYCMGGKSG